MVASRTETKVKNADSVAILERALNVLGTEQIHEITATMAEKPTVQAL